MRIKLFGKGFNYSQDGRGNRLVYHLQGCNMRCPWCSNPEGMGDSGYACKEYEVDELVEEVLRSAPMFFDGGGATLTGGEATLQFEAVRAFLKELRANAVNTALETNGTHRRLSELFPIVDELIMDFKHYDSAVHKAHTGVGNEEVMANIQKAKEQRGQLLIRIPLVGGFNANASDIMGFVRVLKENNFPGLLVELLSYHEFGKDKWAKCGLEYTMKDGYVSGETIKAFADELINNNIISTKT